MANVYFKLLNKSIRAQCAENIIAGLQRELSASASSLNDDIFDLSKGIGTRRVGLDINSLLKYYVINQILKDVQSEGEDLHKLIETPNKNIRKDMLTNEYYKLSDKKEWILVENVSTINEDGSYIINENKTGTGFVQRKLYDAEGQLISVQMINPNGSVIRDKLQSAELLGLRKELVQKHKYSGYSGNSNDLVAGILNKFSAPLETGYYMDNYYNLYKWDVKNKCFIKDYDEFTKSPLLVDYVFDDDKNVIRKEYTGIR